MTEFGTLHPDGTVTNARSIPQAAMLACPHVILVAEHYRSAAEDFRCRCDDPDAPMADWGYTWNATEGTWT